MKRSDLQDKLANLPSDGTFVLTISEAKQAFSFYELDEQLRTAIAELAWMYECSVVFIGPNDSQVLLFTRQNEQRPKMAASK